MDTPDPRPTTASDADPRPTPPSDADPRPTPPSDVDPRPIPPSDVEQGTRPLGLDEPTAAFEATPSEARPEARPDVRPETPPEVRYAEPERGTEVDVAATAVPLPRPRGPRMRTLVLGLVLLAVSGTALVRLLTDVNVDDGVVALGVLLVAGLLLVVGGVAAAARDTREARRM